MRTSDLERMYARINANAYIPPLTPETAAAPRRRSKKERSKMPKPVKLARGKEFSFAKGSAATTKYDWRGWFNPDPKLYPNGMVLIQRSVVKKDDKGNDLLDAEGNVQVEEKRDYDVPNDAMPAKIRTAARRHYKVVAISRKYADGTPLVDEFVLVPRDMTAEECTEEDRLRAEEKAAKKAAKKAATTNGQATEQSASAAS